MKANKPALRFTLVLANAQQLTLLEEAFSYRPNSYTLDRDLTTNCAELRCLEAPYYGMPIILSIVVENKDTPTKLVVPSPVFDLLTHAFQHQMMHTTQARLMVVRSQSSVAKGGAGIVVEEWMWQKPDPAASKIKAARYKRIQLTTSL